MNIRSFIAFFLVFLAGAMLSGSAIAQDACGPVATPGHYGPYDYWLDKGRLPIVENFHFTPKVETLRGGQSSYVGGDLNYTLLAFPNHPRALIAMMKLSERGKWTIPQGAEYTIDCYFDRAIRFRENDGTVRMVYATYLSKRGKKEDAIKQLEKAVELGSSGPNLDYNLGLAYFDVGKYDKALEHAHRAYQRGFNLPGLKSKLVNVGKWRDPPPVAATGAEQNAEAKEGSTVGAEEGAAAPAKPAGSN